MQGTLKKVTCKQSKFFGTNNGYSLNIDSSVSNSAYVKRWVESEAATLRNRKTSKNCRLKSFFGKNRSIPASPWWSMGLPMTLRPRNCIDRLSRKIEAVTSELSENCSERTTWKCCCKRQCGKVWAKGQPKGRLEAGY